MTLNVPFIWYWGALVILDAIQGIARMYRYSAAKDKTDKTSAMIWGKVTDKCDEYKPYFNQNIELKHFWHKVRSDSSVIFSDMTLRLQDFFLLGFCVLFTRVQSSLLVVTGFIETFFNQLLQNSTTFLQYLLIKLPLVCSQSLKMKELFSIWFKR